MSRFQYDDYLGGFQDPSPLDDIGPPEQIAFYSCFINDTNDYRFNDPSALRRYKGGELRLPLLLAAAADRKEFDVTSARLDQVPRPSLVPVISACIGSKSAASVLDADVITRRGALSSLGTGEDMAFTVMYINGKLHLDRKNFVANSEILHDGPYFGHCFEEACTASKALESNGRFCSIVSRRLGDLHIVMAGEVDCAEDGCPSLEKYRELKSQKFRQHKNWPKWYLQSYLLGVPTLVLGNRSKRNQLTSIQTMSMEAVLATTVANSPDFDQALALGRIHTVLSALINHCKTRAGYLYTGCFTCELHIRSQGKAFVPPVSPNREAKAELLRVWERAAQATDVPGGALIFPSLPPVVSEPRQLLLTRTAETFTTPNTLQPSEFFASLLSWAVIVSFALYYAFKIWYAVFFKVLPIATLLFQVCFFFHFAAFALMASLMFCLMIIACASAHTVDTRA